MRPQGLIRCWWRNSANYPTALAIAITISLVTGCNPNTPETGSISLNSRYTDEQPALSGDGRLLALISNRNGKSEILLYDLRSRQFLDLPGLNQQDAIAQTPSLSRTGRYITYIATVQGRPELELYDRATQRSEILSLRYPGWVRNPSISPDGRYIAFESSTRGQWDIEVLDRGDKIELDIADGSEQ